MKRLKVWAVRPAGARGEELMSDGHPYDDKRILLLRTGTNEQGRYDVGEFNGSPMQAMALAYERTRFVGVIVIKDFDEDEWFTGVIGSNGSLLNGHCPEVFRAPAMMKAEPTCRRHSVRWCEQCLWLGRDEIDALNADGPMADAVALMCESLARLRG